MSAQLLEKLMSLGKELGYSGNDLREWVTAQVKVEESRNAAALEREERRLAREEQQREIAAKAQEEKIARQEAKAKSEAEQAERVRMDEAKRAERLKMEEIALEKQKLEQQLKLAELKIAEKKIEKEASEAGSDSDGDGSVAGSVNSTSARIPRGRSGPKLPHFDESKDNIDSYLRRFERYATLQGWPVTEWATFLSALLKGKALEVYSRLTEGDSRSYDKLKAALLRKYQLTAEGFRKQFYSARREKEETASQFVCRLTGYLDRWIQLADIEQTFEGLKDLIVKEQFLTVSEEHLSLYLRERDTKNLEDVIKLADMYLDARIHRDRYSDKKFKGLPSRKPGNGSDQNSGKTNEEKQSQNKEVSGDKIERVCYLCHQPGHIRKNCRLNQRGSKRSTDDVVATCSVAANCEHDFSTEGALRLQCGCSLPFVGCLSVGAAGRNVDARLPIVSGKANGHCVSVLRDTGCTTAVIRSDLVTDEQRTGTFKCYRVLDGSIGRAETATVDVESPVFTGKLDCLCIKSPVCDLIIGNIPEVTSPENAEVVAVSTRAQVAASKKSKASLRVPVLQDLQISCSDMQTMQSECEDLMKYFELAETQQTVCSGKKATVRFEKRKGLLYRIYQCPGRSDIRQLVVPKDLRKVVLGLAHESIMSGHEGINKTSDRVLAQFWWPGLHGDVSRFCRSCDVCQRTTPRGRVTKAPLQKMPIISIPFQRVGVDLVGPITPASSTGKRYILTVVDYATRYPEAVALSGISTVEVAEALCSIYSRVGVPRHVVHDQGSQFMSDVMTEVSRLLSVKNLVSSPYHPQCNGLVERFNGTLKAMLKKLCAERPKDWDRYLESVLFAYREVKQESLGFSPFELLYGRTVRGPMAILRELWTKEESDNEVRTTYQYVLDLRNRLEETCQLVKESLGKASSRAKKYFDKKARMREMQAGDKALILLPTAESKLLMQWKGPYPVLDRVGPTDYRIRIGEVEKVYHVNMLKKYYESSAKEQSATQSSETNRDNHDEVVAAAVIEEDTDDGELNIPASLSTAKETVDDVHIADDLDPEQQNQLRELLHEFEDIFSDIPGKTNVIEHRILLTDGNPIRCKPYPIPHALKDTIIEEVKEMERMGVIAKSDSPYASPLLIVKKKDGSNRPVVDFRRLNRITVFDAEPMPNIDDIYAKLSTARFFSKLDFCKGYWQIPMAPDDRTKTAFCTPLGLYEFTRMPFGLQNACATYSRMMRRVLEGMKQTDNFVDDVISFTDAWQSHLVELKELFSRVRKNGLTVKPSKCYFGYHSLDYVGHKVGQGCLYTLEDKVQQIVNAPVPRTKTQLRSFLGLAGFYRRFVPSYATVAAPLTDLLKKGSPNKLEWNQAQDLAFQELKAMLSSQPVLHLPDHDKQYILRTDASDVGLGAVLLQEHEDGVYPVLYLSRKLNGPERNYSVIERECLAIVWAVNKLQAYLYGKSFILQTDHRPLLFLNQAKQTNARVMRWALALQSYRFRAESIRGADNVGADYLSRNVTDS